MEPTNAEMVQAFVQRYDKRFPEGEGDLVTSASMLELIAGVNRNRYYGLMM